MKKYFYILMTVLVIAALLVSCAPKATEAPVAEQPTEAPAAEQPTEAPAAEEAITLEYWQVDFQGYDVAIQKVIDMFQAEYPNIKINFTPISYDEINEKIAVMVPVGEGPDLVNPFFGWVPLWVKSGFLAPLPEELFPKAEIEETYFSVVDAMYIDGVLYGLPFNQSNWAIWYNKDMFAEAGITKLPENFEELRQAAVACTKRAADGTLEVAGYYVDCGTQEHILWKVLIEKNGQPIFSEDQRTVTWNDSPVGAQSFKWLTDLVTTDKVMDAGFGEGPGQAFMTGLACMRLGSPGNLPVIRATNPELNFDSFPLPKGLAEDPAMANLNQTQYWSMNVTTKAVLDPKRAEAAYTFMRFIMRPEVALTLIKEGMGGLPAHKSLINDPYFTADPQLAAFLATLPNAVPLFWVDEKGERDISMQMCDRVILNGEDPVEVFNWGTEQEQIIRDEFFNN
jgi:multiple sugar transport system substrate-binding protein